MNAQVCLIFVLYAVLTVNGQHYDDTHTIFQTLLNSSRYHTDVVPVLNQSAPISVNVNFNLLSIVSVDDITQSFICNGLFTFYWTDEKLTWDPSDYGGKTVIHPVPKSMWRPRVVLINTLEERDVFADDISPTRVNFNGSAQWQPGSLFSTSCSLSLLKYPFDKQSCFIRMLPMGLDATELIFEAGQSSLNVYTINGEWILEKTWILVVTSGDGDSNISRFDVNFDLRRRPTFYVLNIILPVVFLSFMNLGIYCIPVESGEKISYGTTLVLAISVFLSVTSEMLPRSSQEVPYVTIYLFALYVLSALTVLDSVLIVFLYYIEEKAAYRKVVLNRFRNATHKLTNVRRAITPIQEKDNWSSSTTSPDSKAPLTKTKSIIDQLQAGKSKTMSETDENAGANRCEESQGRHDKSETDKKSSGPSKYKVIGDHLDFFSFFVFIIVWVIINMWFFIAVTT